MGKPVYDYPDFVKDVTLKAINGKRYWLQFNIDEKKMEGIGVILKNPSRANQIISDKTVYNVANYINQNRERHDALKNIGIITILNLIPDYMTDSRQLQTLKSTLIDPENLRILNEYCHKNKKIIIAWGNSPKGLYDDYEELKKRAMKILVENKNEVYFVDRMTKSGNPKHGQVWAYADPLRKSDLNLAAFP